MTSHSYCYCSKCNVWVPYYISDIHIEQCHRKSCDMLHPLVKDGELVAQINIIRNEASNTNSSKNEIKRNKDTISLGKWLYCEEPEIMQRIECKFCEKFAFFNDLDLFICGIEAFTPVLLQANAVETIFIAVPYDNVHIGTICLYEKGMTHHFSISNDTTLVSVKKIENIKLGKGVSLKASSDKDMVMNQRIFKHKFHYNYDYGIPFIFRKYDAVTLEKPEKPSLQLKVSIVDEKISNTCDYFSVENLEIKRKKSLMKSETVTVLNDSFFETSTSLCSALDGISDKLESMEFSRIEGAIAKNDSSFCSNSFKTSTPKREEQSLMLPNGSSEKKKSKQRQKERRMKVVSFEAMSKSHPFYWLSNDSEIEMVVEKKAPETKTIIQYYRNEVFCNVKHMIEKKLHCNKQGRNLHCMWTGILLSGLSGTGKTLLVKELSSELGLPLVTVSLLGWSTTHSPNYVNDCFTEAKKCAPSVLLFDEIDSLCYGIREKNDEFSNKILKVIQTSKTLTKPVILIGATSRPEALPERMKQAGRFDREIILSLPESETRARILWYLLDGQRHTLTQEAANGLGEKAFGFSGADLNTAVQVAWQKAVSRWKNEKVRKGGNSELCLHFEDLQEGIGAVVPSFLRQSYSAVSRVRWSDIFGYDHIKEKLKKMLECKSTHVYCLKGILLFGPPGCSKTLLVRALASETRFTFFPVKCSDLLSKYVGETEKSLCTVFEKAMQSAPSLVFMDEIDSLCGERTGKGAENNVVPELLSLMQKSLKKGNILVVGATNRPRAVDEALLSPGCLELLLHVDLPDCTSRCCIWEGLLKDVPTSQINISSLCSRSEGLSCAEICSAYQKATHSLLASLHLGMVEIYEAKLTEELISRVLSSVSPRTSESVLAAIQSFIFSRTTNL